MVAIGGGEFGGWLGEGGADEDDGGEFWWRRLGEVGAVSEVGVENPQPLSLKSRLWTSGSEQASAYAICPSSNLHQ